MPKKPAKTPKKAKTPGVKFTVPGEKKSQRPFAQALVDVPDLTDEEIADTHAKERDGR